MAYISLDDYLEYEARRKAQNEIVKQNEKTLYESSRAAYENYKSKPQQSLKYQQQPQNDVYIPAQFGQRILDRQRQQEYANRLYNTYIPATLAQDAINRHGAGNDFNAFSDRVLRYDYLNNADTAKMKAELDALNAELKDRNKNYSGATRSDSIVRRVQGDDSELAQSNTRTKEEYEALKARAEQLEKNLRDAEMLQRFAGYEAARNSADFAEKSKAVANKPFSVTDPSTWTNGDSKYNFINNIGRYREGIEFASKLVQPFAENRDYSVYTGLSKMTEDEIALYNYIYSTQGKEAADQYIDDIKESLNYRVAQGDAAAVGNNVLKGMEYGFGAGLARAGTGVVDLFRDEATATPIHEYGSAMVRENLANSGARLPEFMGGSSLGQVGFDMANTAGNMAPSLLLGALSGGVGSAAMGVSAAGNAKMQALRQGYSNEQATKYGLLVGASEGALQYLLGGISKLGGRFTGGIASRAIQNIDNALLKVAANSGIKMAGEGTEEYLQEILEPIYRNLIFNESNQVDLLNPDAVYSFMLGALTSGVMESPNTVRDLAGAVRTEAAKAIERAATPNINGALVGSNSLVQDSGADTVNTPTTQQTTANTGVATVHTATQMMEQPNAAQTKSVNASGVTRIKNPYTGTKPVQAQTVQRSEVAIPYEQVARARENIESAESNKGERSFSALLREAYKSLFRKSTGDVAINGVTFEGQPYVATIHNSVLGKLISDPHMSAEKISVLENLKDVVANSEYVGSGDSVGKKYVARYDYFESRVRINDQRYIAKIDVEARMDRKNRVRTYTINNIDLVPLGVSAQVQTPVEQATSNQGLNHTIPNPAPDVNLESKNNTQEAVDTNPLTIVEKIRKLKRDVSNYTYSPERVYTAEDYKALADKRIEDYTPDDIFAIVSELQNKKGLHNKDMSRVLNSVSGKNLDLRNALYNLIERDFNTASGNHGRMQTRDLTELRDRYIAAGVDLKNKRELSAIMKYGEKGYIDSDGSWVEYGLEDLKREFPEKWEKLSEVAEQDRALYDSYLDRINEMRERIYPEMMKRAQQELESARESVALYTDKISRIEQTISSIENDIASKRDAANSKKRTDTLSFEKLQSSIDNDTKRINAFKREYENAQQKLEDAKFRAARLDEEIRNGEPLHQRKIEPLKNYYHHVGAFDSGILSLIGSKSIVGETVAGKVSDSDTATVVARTIDRLIDSILGKNDIAPGMVGVSDNTKPRVRFQGIMEHRKGGAYKLNSFESMAEYIGIADYMLAFDEYTSNIRDITNILRSAADKIDKAGDTSRNANSFIKWLDDWNNMLTGKTSPLDRGVQDIVGRNVMNGVKKLNSLVRSSTLLNNFRSALIQPSAVANAKHYIPNPLDWVRGGRYIANAMSGKADYADVMSRSNFLSQRDMLTPNDILNYTASRKVKNAQAKMLSVGQNAADKLIWWTAFAKYDEASQTPGGLEKLNASYSRTYENAIDFADDITRKSVAGRGVGEQPITIKSTVVDALAPFQTEVVNQYHAFVENVGTLLGKGSTREQRARAAAGLVSYEISAFAINSLFKAMFGDSALGFDFFGALFAALTGGDDEDEDDTVLKRLGRETTATIMGGLPFASAYTPLLMDTETAKSIFGEDGNPSRYGTGMMGTNAVADLAKTFLFDKNATGWDKANALAAFFPYGGKQIVRTAQGLSTVIQGGSYKTNKDGEEQLQFRTDQKAGDALQAALFGKWALPEAREYVEKGFPILSAPHTAAYKNAIANGVDGAYFLMLLNEYKALEPIKDAEGNTEKSKKQQFREILFNDTELTPEQKQAIDKDILCSDEQTPADYTSRDRFEISTTHAGGIFIPNDDPYERFTENINKGLTEADAVLVEKWARKFSGLKSYTDSEGNEIGVKEQKRDMLLSDSTLTAEEKQLIDRSLISSNNTPADYSSDASFYVSQLSDSAQSGYKLFKASGGSQEKYMEYHKMYDELEPTKDINGEIIPGSRQEALRNNIMNDDDMTPEQKRQLDEALTGGKTRDYTSWFTFKLGKTSGSAYKRGKAYVAAGISETNALLIEQWMDGRKYTKADLRKYLSKLKLTDSEIEAVLEARY